MNLQPHVDPMKEHGLLLSDPMARARHARLKTQTRRLVSSSNTLINGSLTGPKWWNELNPDLSSAWVDPGPSPAGNPGPYLKAPALGRGYQDTTHRLYPRIQPGDRIWWRECMKLMATDDLRCYPELQDGRPVDPGTAEERQYEEYPMRVPIYRATDQSVDLVVEDENGDDKPVPWTPSQFMKRKWARFVDTVTAVRPERLLDISEADAIAEGIVATPGGEYVWDQLALHRSPYDHLNGSLGTRRLLAYPTARECYLGLMQVLHGEQVVEENPWLWVITVEYGVKEQA